MYGEVSVDEREREIELNRFIMELILKKSIYINGRSFLWTFCVLRKYNCRKRMEDFIVSYYGLQN